MNSGILELRLFFNWFWHCSSMFGNHLILNTAFFFLLHNVLILKMCILSLKSTCLKLVESTSLSEALLISNENVNLSSNVFLTLKHVAGQVLALDTYSVGFRLN